MIALTIIGCGNMGRAFAEGLLRSGVASPESLNLVERREERRSALIEELGCRCESVVQNLDSSQYVLFAMKPQDLATAATTVAPLLKESQIVISLLAGVPIEVLRQALGGHRRIVRSMPNLPAVIGSGMSAYACVSEITDQEKDDISRIFNAVGESLELSSEELLNAFTAVAGSGPAYLYYLIESWRNASLKLGFSAEEANILITQTITGSLWLWSDSQNDEKGLRQRVTSKGGTTEAAMAVLDQGRVGELFQEAIIRASQRGKELEKLVREKL